MISNRIKAMVAGVCSLAAVAVLAAAAAPAGAFVYVNQPSGALTEYSGGSSGSLSPLSPFGVDPPTGGGPAVVSPDGNSVFVVNGDWISEYSVAGDGTLSAKPTASVNFGSWPNALAISPGGHYLYAVEQSNPRCYEMRPDEPESPDIQAGAVFQYAIGSGGVLDSTPIGSACTDSDPAGVGVGPGGNTVYVSGADYGGLISQYSVNKSGGLTPLSPATVDVPLSGDDDSPPVGLAVDLSDNTVYMVEADNIVYEFSIGASGGLGAGTVLGSAPSAASSYQVGIVVSPNGKYLYVVGGGVVTELSVASGDIGTVARESGPNAIAITPDGHYFYVANYDGTISQYSVGAGGTLSSIGSADVPLTASGPTIVADQVQTTLTAGRTPPLTLTLTAGLSNTPLAGRTLTFTAGGQSCTTTTNASGQAGACETNTAALTSGFEVTYAGDADYQSSNVQTPPLDEIVPRPL